MAANRPSSESSDSGISTAFSSMSVGSGSVGGSVSGSGLALVRFQLGLLQEVVQASSRRLSFRSAKRLAAEIIERKAPEVSVIGLREKLLLFRHEPGYENILRKLSEQDTLQDGDMVEVVLAESASATVIKFRPHSLVVQSYRTPTFCHHCGEMLWGLVRQGLKCEGCGLDFHKRCALHLPNDCSGLSRRCRSSLSLFPPGRPRLPSLSTQAGGSLEEISMTKTSNYRSHSGCWVDRSGVWGGQGRGGGGGGGGGGGAQLPHTFHVHSYTRPTVCQYCHKLLKGLFRQGLQCADCRFNCHRRCAPLVPNNCLGEARFTNGGDSESGWNRMDVDMESSVESVNDLYEEFCPPSSSSNLPQPEVAPSRPEIGPCFSSNIPLMRVVQSVKHTKRRASGVLRRGWLVHCTNTHSMRKRHYWVLDSKCITLYQTEHGNKYYKEIPLSEVLQIRGTGQMADSEYSFELETATAVYRVVAEEEEEGTAWESAMRQALMPVHGSGIKRAGTDYGLQQGQTQDIGSVYQIFSEEVLGSGQFGIVYGGTHRQSSRPVAVKVIDKTRFPTNLERQMRNEVAILQNLSHLGVVLLEGVFETSELVFVVMEKLHSDMLEMILSHENGRLPERTTRFLVTQILEALRYLHFKHIAHCDLKPENVLLASPDPFPQVKLCDFGFARIIGEKSFRRSVVGTPAYLAPEVISSSGYNRSLDMWAVGVILYVSLSGTFPFNEDEDISQQITNAAFMYPRHPWSLISLEAVSLIKNLLQVVVRRRFSVGKALGHPWLQNFQLWCDLREFEQHVGRRYLTHEEEDERWRRLAAEKGLDFPSHLTVNQENEDSS
ncbi:protein kinase D4 isoform X1 [Alosa pseudoharengus]|uniref:protein kinase D4 isoform X1 n=1 Tax=Alosa pseudoharengus TaxID=34774 RepID=UPI003F897464